MTPEERAAKALAPLLNPEPHPLREDWSDGHSMSLDSLVGMVASAIRDAEQEATEKAWKEAGERLVLLVRTSTP